MARQNGACDEADIENEIRCWALGEWRGVLRLAKRRSDAARLDHAQWTKVVDELRARHIRAWAQYSEA